MTLLMIEWVKETGVGDWWWWWGEEDMSVLCPRREFLYCWIDFGTQLVTPVREDPRLEPIRHVMGNSPSILQDIASFSTGRGYVLG